MTETFYIRVDITSNETLYFYEDEDDAAQTMASPAKNKRFNTQVEKAMKKMLMENVHLIDDALEDIEGIEYEKQQVLETITSRFYDAECDLVAICENMLPDIKFSVQRKKKKKRV